MSKKLTLSELKKINQEQENAVKEVTVGEYKFQVKEHWNLTDIDKVIHNFQERIYLIQEKELEVDEKTLLTYQMFLLVKQFTNVLDNIKYNPGGEKGFSKELDIIELLINGGFFSPIIESFPKSEMEKFNNIQIEFAKKLNMMIEAHKESDQEQKELLELYQKAEKPQLEN